MTQKDFSYGPEFSGAGPESGLNRQAILRLVGGLAIIAILTFLITTLRTDRVPLEVGDSPAAAVPAESSSYSDVLSRQYAEPWMGNEAAVPAESRIYSEALVEQYDKAVLKEGQNSACTESLAAFYACQNGFLP